MKFKRVLATTMVAAMVLASSVTAFAADKYPNLKGVKSEVLIGGDVVQTEVAGDYSAESVRGMAITTEYQDVKDAMGLGDTQKPAVVIYDAVQKSSPDAIATLEAATDQVGAKSVAAIYFQLGAKENHKWIAEDKLMPGEVNVKVGLPKGADKTANYSVICVKENGIATIAPDLDSNEKTVTFRATVGVATYGIVSGAVIIDTPTGEEADTTSEAVIDTIAKEVYIKGIWGVGQERKTRLEEAGYNYEAVQKRVAEIMQ